MTLSSSVNAHADHSNPLSKTPILVPFDTAVSDTNNMAPKRGRVQPWEATLTNLGHKMVSAFLRFAVLTFYYATGAARTTHDNILFIIIDKEGVLGKLRMPRKNPAFQELAPDGNVNRGKRTYPT